MNEFCILTGGRETPITQASLEQLQEALTTDLLSPEGVSAIRQEIQLRDKKHLEN